MKKLIKWVAYLVGAVALLAGAGASFIAIRGIPSYAVEGLDRGLTIEVTPERVAEGKRLSDMLCAECHMDPTSRQLVGRLLIDAPKEFGPIYSKNITQHPEKGIGSWTDGELAFFLRTGIRPHDGQFAPPPMVKMSRVSDEHLAAIVAYLRSDDPSVAAVDVDDHESEPTFLMKFLSTVAFKPFAYPTGPVEAPPVDDAVAYGKYLVDDLLDCYGCHSADFKTMDTEVPERSEGYLGGGNMLLDFSGREVYTANITFDDTGIGAWTEADFMKAMRSSVRPDGTVIRYPMPNVSDLTDAEISAIYAYLQTVPKIHNPRRPWQYELEGGDASEGLVAYRKYGCQSCHGQTGVGIGDLRPAHQKYASDDELVEFLRFPSKVYPGTRMPDWDGVIAEDDYPPLVAYVRQLGQGAPTP